jgi:hypothetical protein
VFPDEGGTTVFKYLSLIWATNALLGGESQGKILLAGIDIKVNDRKFGENWIKQAQGRI